jgi:hypothetical protein
LSRSETLSLLAVAALALPACDPVDLGSGGYDTVPPPAGFAAEMIDAHNAVRLGAEPVPDPPLPDLGWSPGVASTAQAWADGCSYRHNPSLHALGLGENIAASAPPGARGAAEIVELWAAEAADYDHATNTCAPGKVCGHYTQIVWRDTTALGCAVRTCSTGSPFGSGSWDFWVCDYAPPGNWVGERPY